MEGVVVAPGSASARLKSRVRSGAARGAKSGRQLLNGRNHGTGHGRSGRRSNANQRHPNNINNGTGGQRNVVDNAPFGNNNGNAAAHDSKIICFGDFTREVYNAICPRLGHTLHIPEESVQALFNDMQLYPSNSQVSEMMQCARQCGRRNGAAKFITFGEFCVLVREMQHRTTPQCNPSNNKCTGNCEVFLGGSCNPTTWRMDTAIPELQKCGITYYNPQVSMWAPELIAKEHNAKQAASVLLFVVDSQTRSTGGMIEVAYLVASGRCVVLVAHPYRPGQSIMGETLTQREYRDLVEGQESLLMLVKSRGIKVHTNLSPALQSTANMLRNSTDNGVSTEEQIMNKLRKLRETFDSYGGQTGEIKFYDALKAFEKLAERPLNISEIKEMAKYLIPSNGVDNGALSLDNARISFERFCTVMAEFATDRCDVGPTTTTCTNNRDAWATQSFQRQRSTNNNSLNGARIDDVDHESPTTPPPDRRHGDAYDVFLGGTCRSARRWRRDVAIPILKKHGVTYYNPAVRERNGGYEVLDNGYADRRNEDDADVLRWKRLMDRARVLLFVIPDDARSLTTMIVAAHYIGLGKSVVLAIQSLPENGCVIQNETQTLQAVKDYNRGRDYLADLAKRKSVPVFQDITEAVQCVVDLCQSG